MYVVKGMYSIMTNISATANHFRIVFIGVLHMSLRVSTIILSMLAMVPKMHTCNDKMKCAVSGKFVGAVRFRSEHI